MSIPETSAWTGNVYLGENAVCESGCYFIQEYDFRIDKYWFDITWDWTYWYTQWEWFYQYASLNYGCLLATPSTIYQWTKLKYIEMLINIPNGAHWVWVKYNNEYWIRYNSDPNIYKVWRQNKYDTSVGDMTGDMIFTINFDSNTTVSWTINWQAYTITHQILVEWLQSNRVNKNFYFVIDSRRNTKKAWIKKIKIISE